MHHGLIRPSMLMHPLSKTRVSYSPKNTRSLRGYSQIVQHNLLRTGAALRLSRATLFGAPQPTRPCCRIESRTSGFQEDASSHPTPAPRAVCQSTPMPARTGWQVRGHGTDFAQCAVRRSSVGRSRLSIAEAYTQNFVGWAYMIRRLAPYKRHQRRFVAAYCSRGT